MSSCNQTSTVKYTSLVTSTVWFSYVWCVAQLLLILPLNCSILASETPIGLTNAEIDV